MYGKVVILVLLAIVLQRVVKLLLQANVFDVVHNHRPGRCTVLPGAVNGSEDLVTLQNGVTYVSSGLYADRGRLLMFDFNSVDKKMREFEIIGDLDKDSFHPFGMSTWQDPTTGMVRLLAINAAQNTVELFDHDGTSQSLVLRHVETIRDTLIFKLNNIVATGADSFYATMFASFPVMSYTLGLHQGKIMYYDGERGRIITSGLFYPNGINLSRDKKHLYMSEWGTGAVNVYKRNADQSLELKQTFRAHAAVDNIELDPGSNNLWIAAQHSTLDFMLGYIFPYWFKDRQLSSLVFYLKTIDGAITELIEVFADDGNTLSGASVASYHKGKLLIGTVQSTALLCEIQFIE